MRNITSLLLSSAFVPFLFGFGSCGGVLTSATPTPDMNGTWAVEYGDSLEVEITIGGALYTSELGLQGGTIDIEHDGQPLSFDLNCEDEDIICPSEVWPAEVDLEQREPQYPHRVWMSVPRQECDAELVPADPAECGEDTNNPDCADVCEGEMVTVQDEAFGLINEEGTEMAVLLGASGATNGVNCALLGVSIAAADIVATGSEETADWTGTDLTPGEVVVGYAGGCLWADDVDGDSELEAVVLEASIVFSTDFEATRVPSNPWAR